MQNEQAQKSGFKVLFLIEMWERFGFYTVCSLLVLYMTKALGFSDAVTYTAFASFSALLYITPMIGGYLADRHLGYGRSLVIGVISLLCGYICLSIPNSHQGLFFGLALVIIGGGFFKSMPYAMLGKLYENEPEKLDGKFTLYYLAINIGGIPALVFAGTIAHYIGWNAAFAVAAFGLVIALLVFSIGKKYLLQAGNYLDHRPVATSLYLAIFLGILLSAGFCSYLLIHPAIANFTIYIIAALGLLYLLFAMRKLNRLEQKRILACVAMFIIGGAFFIFYYQAPTSLTLFVDRHVDHHVLGVYLPSSSYWGFNPVWIIILGPILSRLYRALGKHDPSIPMKFGLGIILMGVGYYFITLGIHFSNKAGVISSWWIIGSYGFQAMAELFVSALGNGLASRYAPKHLVGIMIGLWFLTTSLGGIISGKLASLAAVDPHTQDPMVTLAIYQHAFFNYGNIALVIGLIGCACAPLIMWLSRERPIQ